MKKHGTQPADLTSEKMLRCDRCQTLSTFDKIHILPGEILCKRCLVKKQVALIFKKSLRPARVVEP